MGVILGRRTNRNKENPEELKAVHPGWRRREQAVHAKPAEYGLLTEMVGMPGLVALAVTQQLESRGRMIRSLRLASAT